MTEQDTTAMDEWGSLQWWSNSSDQRAVNVRRDIIRGLFKCHNEGYETDMAYLTDPLVIKASISRCGYKLHDIGE